DILPIEIFKIDDKTIVRNSNLEKYYTNEEKNIDSGIINNWISYYIKNNTVKNTLVLQRIKNNNTYAWEH
ncbi:hypothetical protein ACOL3I_11870, partial [Aliarcobacter butzleri]